jgi:hypothetical protein
MKDFSASQGEGDKMSDNFGQLHLREADRNGSVGKLDDPDWPDWDDNAA